MVLFLLFAAAAAAAPPAGVTSLSHTIMLIGTIVLLLGVFFISVVLLTRSHRQRHRSERSRESPALPDPWREAGRRLEPPGPDQHDGQEDRPS